MRLLSLLVLIISHLACSSVKKATSVYGIADGKVEWIFLQMNDVYEIGALDGGKIGGMARVATLRKELLKENPNTYTVMAGDFLNPSLIGTLKYEGEGIKGRQMVEVMNATGINYVFVDWDCKIVALAGGRLCRSAGGLLQNASGGTQRAERQWSAAADDAQPRATVGPRVR